MSTYLQGQKRPQERALKQRRRPRPLSRYRRPFRHEMLAEIQTLVPKNKSKNFVDGTIKSSLMSGIVPDSVTIKQEKKEQVSPPFFGCCRADSQTDTGRHQLYNNGSLVLFFSAWSQYVRHSCKMCLKSPCKVV